MSSNTELVAKATALRSMRKALWDLLDSQSLQVYSKDEFKEYIFLSMKPKEDAKTIATEMAAISPYVTVHSYVFGNEQIISIDGMRTVIIYLCDTDIVTMRLFEASKAMCLPQFFEDKQGGRKRPKDKHRPKQNKTAENPVDKYFRSCLIPFYRKGKFVTSSDMWRVAKELKKKLDKTGYNKFRYSIENKYLFPDFRMKSIRFTEAATGKDILYLFNTLEYEAVPLVDGELHPHMVYRYELYNSLVYGHPVPAEPEKIDPEEYKGLYVSEKLDKFKLGGFMVRLPI